MLIGLGCSAARDPGAMYCPSSPELMLCNNHPQVKLPLEIGTRVDCKWRDGEFHPARVIERRPVEGTDLHEYYVHYSKCESSV